MRLCSAEDLITSVRQAGWLPSVHVNLIIKDGSESCHVFEKIIDGVKHQLLYRQKKSMVFISEKKGVNARYIGTDVGIYCVAWDSNFSTLHFEDQFAIVHNLSDLTSFVQSYSEIRNKDYRNIVKSRRYQGVFTDEKGMNRTSALIFTSIAFTEDSNIKLYFNNKENKEMANIILKPDTWDYVLSSYLDKNVAKDKVKISKIETRATILRRTIGDENYEKELQKEANKKLNKSAESE